jgi:uncharacterized protein (DUF433 family)
MVSSIDGTRTAKLQTRTVHVLVITRTKDAEARLAELHAQVHEEYAAQESPQEAVWLLPNPCRSSPTASTGSTGAGPHPLGHAPAERAPRMDRFVVIVEQTAGMDWRTRITADPAVLVGKPVVKGTRLAVEFIIGLLAAGWTHEQILDNYPGLTLEDIRACLAYAGELLQQERVFPLGA